MDKEGEDADGGGIKIPNPNPNLSNGSAKGKSCKGCLYYSSTQKSKSKYPTCVGLSKTLQQGYSVFLDRKDSSSDQQNKQAELPFCVGLEVLYDKKPAGHAQADAPAHKIEENVRPIPQPQSYRPPHSTGDEYLNRFKRNAILVASGVAKNVNRVGSYIKQSVDDILYPYRRRPK
ncbi:uncharacterized protein LOC18767722 isoform X2 [Prunus persica]|uniref:uncharacterized protein LOC18767722 isoform X2 n=1 Tax=Prunus persica TaxID=3760 RepID=UPI0009AB8F51|nr:uncharacterized protein LOC18767722 isoform X2 [Prunus persica]